MPARIYVKGWRNSAEEYGALLAGITPASLPLVLADLKPIWSRMRHPVGMLLNTTQRAERAYNLLGQAFALALLENGWDLHASPAQFYLQRGEEKINPQGIIGDLRSRALSDAVWLERCRSLGIENLSLGFVKAAAAAESS